MNRSYWDKVSESYQKKVLSVFDHDLKGLVLARIEDASRTKPSPRAADLGCGVGLFTPSLAEAFASVEACDLSPTGIEATRHRCANYANVRYHQLDFIVDPIPFEPVDFALCVNVLLMPALDERLRAWRCVTNQIASGGTLLLVAPSLESIQMECFRAVDAFLEDGESCADAIRLGHEHNATSTDLQQGVHLLDGLRTKHYLKAELEAMLANHEFDVQEIVKIEYSARTVAGAWDWLALAKRR